MILKEGFYQQPKCLNTQATASISTMHYMQGTKKADEIFQPPTYLSLAWANLCHRVLRLKLTPINPNNPLDKNLFFGWHKETNLDTLV